MLKLISVNIEEDRHYDLVINFLQKENPDVVCLQEVPETFLETLVKHGYTCSFAKMFSAEHVANNTSVGVAIASKTPHIKSVNYYYHNIPEPRQHNVNKLTTEMAYVYLSAKLTHDGEEYDIRTTHPPVTRYGVSDKEQEIAIEKLLTLLKLDNPHVICGDFNIPRNINHLYNNFIINYTDAIPLKYKSSLDQNIHKFGNVVLDDLIFEKYMVDYVFTQSPYKATDVRLEFGISDHAAIVAMISKDK